MAEYQRALHDNLLFQNLENMNADEEEAPEDTVIRIAVLGNILAEQAILLDAYNPEDRYT